MRGVGLVAAVLVALAPRSAAAQGYPWQRLAAVGDTTGFVSAMGVEVAIADGVITATIEERHFDGSTITLTERAALADLNVEVGSARESNRSIHPHLSFVSLRCRGDTGCVSYSSPRDLFFELPGPRVFGFFVLDRPTADRALADLKRLYEGGF